MAYLIYLKAYFPSSVHSNLASFFNNFCRGFISSAKFEWTDEGKDAFKSIKDGISRSPLLISPDYSKEFQIFSFASEDTIAGVLIQKNKEG